MQKPKNKAIITAALTGVFIHQPCLPICRLLRNSSLMKILAVHEVGGAVAHLHVRDPKTVAQMQTRIFSGRLQLK